MRRVPAEEIAALSNEVGEVIGPPHWLEGPHNGLGLDVGVATFGPGVVVPPHIHIGGQVMVVTAGRGFVESGDERIELEPGDVVICPPGELHVHGAIADQSFSHLTVTTGGYTFPDDPA